ncbi:MAG TPA: hypothetical protein VMT42_06650 [candidate division Zixibacteria bacterium]|nr:hypothetical protein [candidate division Zixibacteria bacterium]
MKFVEGCDFNEFSKYLAKLGQYTGEGELERLGVVLKADFFI